MRLALALPLPLARPPLNCLFRPCHPLPCSAYWFITYLWYLLLYVVYMIIFIVFGTGVGLESFRRTNMGEVHHCALDRVLGRCSTAVRMHQ